MVIAPVTLSGERMAAQAFRHPLQPVIILTAILLGMLIDRGHRPQPEQIVNPGAIETPIPLDTTPGSLPPSHPKGAEAEIRGDTLRRPRGAPPALAPDEMFLPPLQMRRLPFGGSSSFGFSGGKGGSGGTRIERKRLLQNTEEIVQEERQILEHGGRLDYLLRYEGLYKALTGQSLPQSVLDEIERLIAQERAQIESGSSAVFPGTPPQDAGSESSEGQSAGTWIIVKKHEYRKWLETTTREAAELLALPQVRPQDFLLYEDPKQQGPKDTRRRQELMNIATLQHPLFDPVYRSYTGADNGFLSASRKETDRIYRRHWGTWRRDRLSERALLRLLGTTAYAHRAYSLEWWVQTELRKPPRQRNRQLETYRRILRSIEMVEEEHRRRTEHYLPSRSPIPSSSPEAAAPDRPTGLSEMQTQVASSLPGISWGGITLMLVLAWGINHFEGSALSLGMTSLFLPPLPKWPRFRTINRHIARLNTAA
jgi:hypothetical protein